MVSVAGFVVSALPARDFDHSGMELLLSIAGAVRLPHKAHYEPGAQMMSGALELPALCSRH